MVSHPRTHREGFLGSGTKVKPLADSRYFPAGEGKLIMMVFSHARINGKKATIYGHILRSTRIKRFLIRQSSNFTFR